MAEDEPGPDADTDWLSEENLTSKGSARDRLRRARVSREEPVAADEGPDADIDAEEGAFDEVLGSLDAGGALVPEGRDPDAGCHVGASNGWLEVAADDEGQRAVLHYLDLDGDNSVDTATILALLAERFQVRSGVDEPAVTELLGEARKGPVEGEFTVATATPAEKGADGRVELLFLEGLEEEQPAYRELPVAFERKQIDDVVSHCPVACLVGAGTLIARIAPPTDGTPGTDVFGNKRVEPGEAPEVKLGQNVQQTAEGFAAEITGYPYYLGGLLAVVSPLWLSPDRLEAFVVLFRLLGPPPTLDSEAVLQLLHAVEARHGIQEAAIERLCRETPAGPQSILVARGVPPVHGQDTHVAYDLDTEPKPGAFLEDGTIDLRQRNTVITVSEGQYLGQLVPARKGRDGMTVIGAVIEARNGEKRPFKPGRNLRIEEQDEGGPKFYAAIDGSIRAREDSLSVEKVFLVEGDVDYEVGNIETTADVEVTGSVTSGFRIKSAGSVVVAGVIESGAVVQAGGDVVAAGGIVGEKTRVVARGGVEAKYVQNSAILAQGDIHIGSYLHNGNVRCGGHVVVNSGGDQKRGGSLVGGQVVAGRSIEVMRLGSEMTDRTLVGVRGTPTAERQLAESKKVVAAADKAVVKVLRTLGISKVNAQLLKRCILSAPKERRGQVLETIRTLQGLVGKRQEAVNAMRETAREISEALAEATIRVKLETYPDVIVQIGEEARNVPEKVTGQVFYRGEDGVAWRAG